MYDNASIIWLMDVSYHGLIEENEIHHGIALVELLQLRVQHTLQLHRVRHGDIGIGGTRPAEGREDHRRLEHLRLMTVCERYRGRCVR